MYHVYSFVHTSKSTISAQKMLIKLIIIVNIGLRNMFVAFLYFLLFYNDFLLLGKMYIFIR